MNFVEAATFECSWFLFLSERGLRQQIRQKLKSTWSRQGAISTKKKAQSFSPTLVRDSDTLATWQHEWSGYEARSWWIVRTQKNNTQSFSLNKKINKGVDGNWTILRLTYLIGHISNMELLPNFYICSFYSISLMGIRVNRIWENLQFWAETRTRSESCMYFDPSNISC